MTRSRTRLGRSMTAICLAAALGVTAAGPAVGSPAPAATASETSSVVTAASPAREAYIRAVYRDLFDREADAGGVAYWLAQPSNSEYHWRSVVAEGTVSSAEHHHNLIDEAYRRYLGRTADAQGRQHWLRMLTERGWTQTEMEAHFLASEEHLRATGTFERWVDSVYRLVLDRPAEPGAAAAWQARLPELGFPGIARHILLSEEHLTTVVDGWYLRLLDVRPTEWNRKGLIAYIQTGFPVEEVPVSLLTRDDYWAAATR